MLNVINEKKKRNKTKKLAPKQRNEQFRRFFFSANTNTLAEKSAIYEWKRWKIKKTLLLTKRNTVSARDQVNYKRTSRRL